MVKNRIKVQRVEANITATSLAAQLPDEINKVGFSVIENGKALPTRRNLEKMCELLGCGVTDLYDAEDIDLLAVGRNDDPTTSQRPTLQQPMEMMVQVDHTEAIPRIRITVENTPAGDTDVESREKLSIWIAPKEKLALFAVVKGLGYASIAEWFREMYRNTVERYINMNLNGNLTEAVTTTQNQKA